MTLREMWLTFTGRPEQAAEISTADSHALTGAHRRRPDVGGSRVEALDWATTDSPKDLKKRAESLNGTAATD